MQIKHYIKFYLVNDVILATVLVLTGMAWYEIIGNKQENANNVEQESVAELVPLNIDDTDTLYN